MNEVDKKFKELTARIVSEECSACGSITCTEPGGWECNILTLHLSDREPLGGDCDPGEFVEVLDLDTGERVHPDVAELLDDADRWRRKIAAGDAAGRIPLNERPKYPQRAIAGPRDILALVESFSGATLAVRVPAASVGKVPS